MCHRRRPVASSTPRPVAHSHHRSRGRRWQVAEVIAVDEHTGACSTRCLPPAGRCTSASQISCLLRCGWTGQTVVELTAPGQQRTVRRWSFRCDDRQDQRYITPLTCQGPRATNGLSGASLVMAPDESLAYIGLDMPNPQSDIPDVLVMDVASGAITGSLTLDIHICAAPAAAGQPAGLGFSSAIPYLDISKMVSRRAWMARWRSRPMASGFSMCSR